jgi:hypothetical protein
MRTVAAQGSIGSIEAGRPPLRGARRLIFVTLRRQRQSPATPPSLRRSRMTTRSRARGALLASLVLSLNAATAAAQRSSAARVWEADTLPTIGSLAEDRARLRQLRGASATDGWLARSLSARLGLEALPGDSLAWRVLAPELYVVHNSALPFSQNDGLMWAGRGYSTRVRGGVAGTLGKLHAVIMPEIAVAQNDSFADVDISQWHVPFMNWGDLSPFASEWNQYPASADVPVRFGAGEYRQASLGQSALWYEDRGVAVGIATENLWWGPGVHDAFIMTNNAAGVPHAFVRTARPVRTGVGDFEGTLIVGALAESDFYDYRPGNDHRSLSAGVLTYRPSWERDLTVGLARAVYAPVNAPLSSLGHTLDVFGAFHRPGSRSMLDSAFTGGRDQLTSVFARWRFPRYGTELYGELGRAERPANLRDLLVDPEHTRAYLYGGQFAKPIGDAALRVQLEFAQMEQGPSYRYRPEQSWYTSRAMPQGYTQKGQVIGATIGPGSSHQWLAVDYVAPTWTAGIFAGRWRFNTDAMFSSIDFPPGTGSCEYDTTLYPGVRGSHDSRLLGLVQLDAIWGTRLNAFHQNNSGCPAPDEHRHLRDVRNLTFRLTFAPRIGR